MFHKTLTSIAATFALTLAPATIVFADEPTPSPAEAVLEAASETVDLNWETLAAELTAEITAAIENNVISAETVTLVLEAGSAATNELVSENIAQWETEESAWIEAEQTVSESTSCDLNDPSCAQSAGKTIQTLATEELLAAIQQRIDAVLALPETERAGELQDLSEDVTKLRARLTGSAVSDDDDDDDDDFSELRAESRDRSEKYDDDIAERLAKVLYGTDDVLEDDSDDDSRDDDSRDDDYRDDDDNDDRGNDSREDNSRDNDDDDNRESTESSSSSSSSDSRSDDRNDDQDDDKDDDKDDDSDRSGRDSSKDDSRDDDDD